MALMSSVIPSAKAGSVSIPQPHTAGAHVDRAAKQTASAGSHVYQAVKDTGAAIANVATATGEEIMSISHGIYTRLSDTYKHAIKSLTDKAQRQKAKQDFINQYMFEIKVKIFDAFITALKQGGLHVDFFKTYNDMVKVQRELVEEMFRHEFGY